MKRALLFPLLFLTCATHGCGQSQATAGVIQGAITDPTGAAVPGAKIEARNLETNFTRSQDSDLAGRFVLLQMPPGRYTLTTTKAGFANRVHENLQLTVGQTLTLPISMQISSLSEAITISADPVEVS